MMWRVLMILMVGLSLIGQCAVCEDSYVSTPDGWNYHYRNGQVISASDQAGNVWDWINGAWVPQTRCRCGVNCPADCTCGCSHHQGLNFGVNREQISHGERFVANGREVSKQEAMDLIKADKKLPDDSNFLRVTVISSNQKLREQVLQDFQTSDLAPWKDKVVIQDYTPDHWRAKEFQPADPITIVVSAPNGRVLSRQTDYSDGPAGLAQNIQAAQDNYDPNQTPDYRGNHFLQEATSVAKHLFSSEHGICICFSAGVIVAILIFRKKEKK